MAHRQRPIPIGMKRRRSVTMERDCSNDSANPPRIMIEGFYGAGNLGDEAILAGTIRLLRERLPGVPIMVVSQNPAQTQSNHPVMAIHNHDLHGQSAALERADCLLFGGGGLCNDYWQIAPSHIFDDAWGGLPHYLRLPLLARLHEVPFAVWLQGVGPLTSPTARRLVRYVFEQAGDISVRDRYSADLLRDLGVTSPIKVGADPAIVVDPDFQEADHLLEASGVPLDDTPRIGVSIRPFPSITPATVQLLARSVGEFATSIGARVVMLPFCHAGPNNDRDTCSIFVKALPSGVPWSMIEQMPSPQGGLGLVGRMGLVVATRYHAALFAMHQGVPFVGIAYDRKVTNLIHESGISELKALHIYDLAPGQIIPLMQGLWDRRAKLHKQLVKATETLRSRVNRTADRLCELALWQPRMLTVDPDRLSAKPWTPKTGAKSIRKTLTDERSELAQTRKAWEETTHKLRELEQSKADLLMQLAEAKADAEHAKKLHEQARTDIQRLQARLEDAEAQAGRFKAEAEHTKQLHEQARADIQRLQTQLAEAQAKTERLETELGLLKGEAEQQAQQLNEEARKLRSEVERLRKELIGTRDQCAHLEKQLDTSHKATARLTQENQELKRKLKFAEERYRGVAQQLQQIWDSHGWQFINTLYNNRLIGGLWAWVKRAVPIRTKEWAKRQIRRMATRRMGVTAPPETPRPTEATRSAPSSSDAAPSSPTSNPEEDNGHRPRTKAEVIEDLRTFLDRVNRSSVRDLVLFVAGVKFVESEGQRVTQIIRSLVPHDIFVLLIYFRWRSEYHQPVPRSHDPRFFQLPMDLFEPHREGVIHYPFRTSLRRSCIFEFPHPHTFQWVNEFNLAGWKTLYDIIDDWEEFHRAGKAVWYEPTVERYLCANANSVAAIVPLLADKARQWVPSLKVHIVPNGVSPDSFDMTLPARPLPRGKITVGYFGYLAQAWFDWHMVAEIAERHPDWVFHIVGYGEPVPVKLTPNVHLLGKVLHHELYRYTQNWDVGMVPFKPTVLSKGADPIKVYEYLTLGLPVVATDIPHLREYPDVHVARSVDEFDRLLEHAARNGSSPSTVKPFLARSTWHQRGMDLIAAAQAGRDEPIVLPHV